MAGHIRAKNPSTLRRTFQTTQSVLAFAVPPDTRFVQLRQRLATHGLTNNSNKGPRKLCIPTVLQSVWLLRSAKAQYPALLGNFFILCPLGRTRPSAASYYCVLISCKLNSLIAEMRCTGPAGRRNRLQRPEQVLGGLLTASAVRQDKSDRPESCIAQLVRLIPPPRRRRALKSAAQMLESPAPWDF
jgi:hypothetical protein